MTLHLGIDIGVQGAIAIIDQSGALVEIHDMPVLKDGPAGRRAINAPLLAAVIFTTAGPGIEGVLAAAGLPCTFLTPPCWKRTVGLTLASKDASRAEAIRRWPGNAAEKVHLPRL